MIGMTLTYIEDSRDYSQFLDRIKDHGFRKWFKTGNLGIND